MQLDQIINLDDLEREIKAGYINRRFHPEFPNLATIGYSDRCQFDNHWTPTTQATRGIIYEVDTLKVLARPFAKIFNHGQGDEQYDPDKPILGAFNKYDGSLGIGYTRPDGQLAIATRGSFDSLQARHASAHPDMAGMTFREGFTPLFEIIYPENRIVLDYGDMDALVYLGSIDIDSGEYIPPADWESEARTLRDVLAAEPQKNAEGFVAWIDSTTAVKFKQDDYLALHRIVSSLTVKEIWRQLRARTYDEFVVALPDEFHDWAKKTMEELCENFVELFNEAHRAHHRVLRQADSDRKSQALWITANLAGITRGLVFSLLDGKDISDSIWRAVEPRGTAEEIPTVELLGAK